MSKQLKREKHRAIQKSWIQYADSHAVRREKQHHTTVEKQRFELVSRASPSCVGEEFHEN